MMARKNFHALSVKIPNQLQKPYLPTKLPTSKIKNYRQNRKNMAQIKTLQLKTPRATQKIIILYYPINKFHLIFQKIPEINNLALGKSLITTISIV